MTRCPRERIRRWPAPVSRLARGIGPGQGTTQRFVLLVVLFITGSVYMLGTAFQQLVDPQGFGLACEVAAGIDPNADSPANGLDIATSRFNDCLALHASGWRYVWLPLAATVLVVLLALAHYALYPRWQRRRRRICPLGNTHTDRAVRQALNGITSRIKLTTELDYVVDLSAAHPGARVFGRPGKYTVCLNVGLIAVYTRDTGAFEATMLHEFAHIRNRDVGITYLTVAIWRVFLVCALMPLALTQVFRLVSDLLSRRSSPLLAGQLPAEAGNIVLAAFIVMLIYLAMADVLRSREHFADLDAVDRGADRVYWLRNVAAVPPGRDRPGIARTLRAALRTHPSWEKRHAILVRSRDVYTVSALSMFITGMVAQLLTSFMGVAPIGMSYSWIADNAIWPAAGLTTAVAGFAVWRNVAHELAAGRPAPSGLRAGLWLGVGQLAGALLVSEATGHAWFPPFPWVLTLGLLVVVPTAILWWTAGCASLWSRRAGLRGTALQAATLAVTLAAFAWWFESWESAGTVYILGNPNPTSTTFADFFPGFPHTPTTEIMAIVTGPTVDLVVGWGIWLTAALWIVSLIAARTRGARAIGVWAGCAAVLSVIFITFRAHSWIGHGDLTLGQNELIHEAWIFGILLCASVAAAIIVSLRNDGHAVSAMAAAGIAMALGSAAVIATFETDGCIGPLAVADQQCVLGGGTNWDLYATIFEWLLPTLGMLTLVIAASVTGIVRMAAGGKQRRGTLTTPSSATATRSIIWRRLAWTGSTAACLVLAGLSVPAYIGLTALGSTTSPNGQRQSAFDAPAAGSAQLQGLQLQSWGWLGGESIIDRFDGDASKLAAMSPNESAHEDAMKSVCFAVESVVANAQAYLQPPDTLIAPSWSAAIGEAATGARECLAGFSRNNSSLAISGIYEIYDADHKVDNIDYEIGNLMKASPIRPSSLRLQG